MKVLDTDTCIELLRGNRRVIEKRAADGDEVVTTWINAAELHYGAAKSRDPQANRALVDEFLDSLAILGLDQLGARVFGEAKATIERTGVRLPDADLLIGSIALSHGATVVSGNQAHLGRIPGLAVQDWIRG